MMKGMCKEFDTVILNGSDDVVRNIKEAIDIVTKERFGKSVSRTLGNSNVRAVSTITNARTYKKIRGMIEQAYPNTCIFYARL